MTPVGTLHLGFCEHVGKGFARLRPVMTLRSGGWVPILNPRATFPEVGKVFTYDGPVLRSTKGSPWVFRCTQNGRLGEDRFLATDPVQPSEILALPSQDSEKTRRILVETGLALANPPTQAVVIDLGDGHCLRLRLREDGETGRWRASHEQDLERLPTFSSEALKGATAVVERRAFLGHDIDLGEPIGMVDWSPDIQFVGKVLARLRRTQRFVEGGDMGVLSRTAIERFNTALRDSEILSSDPVADDAMRARLVATSDLLQRTVAAATGIGSTLLAMPAVQAVMRREIDAGKSRELASLRTELLCSVEQGIEMEVAERRRAVTDLDREVESRTARVEALGREVTEITRERDALRSHLAGDAAHLVDTVGRTAAALGRAVDIARHLHQGNGGRTDAHVIPPWAEPPRGDVGSITTAGLRDALTRRECRGGFRPGSMLTLDAMARAGEFVVLFGEDAERVLDAYAGTVAAGAMWRMPLDPTFLGLDDLWRDPARKERTTFAEAWLEAERTPDVHVVAVLDDLDSALGCSWLPALAVQLRRPRRPSNLLVLGTLATGSDARGPSAAILRAGMPFVAEAQDGGFAAAAAAVLSPQDVATTVLRAETPREPSPEALGRLLGGIGAIPGIDPTTATRAARLMRVAETTLGSEEATALAVEAAIRLSSASQPATVTGSRIGQAFESLARRQARMGI